MTQAQALGAALAARRRALGVSLRRLADRAGYDRRTLARMEAGAAGSVQALADVAQALGLSLDLVDAARRAAQGVADAR